MRISHRLHTPLLLGGPVVVTMAAAAAAAHGGPGMLVALAAAAASLAVVVVSVPPRHIFLAWLLLAPFLQDVGNSGAAHALRIAFFSFPPLLFAVQTLVERRSIRGSIVDVLPGAYAALVVGSALLAGVDGSATQLFSVVVIGVIVYYFSAFASLGAGVERRVIGVVLLTGTAVSVTVVVAKFAGLNFGAQTDRSANVTRQVGPFGDPSYLGVFVGASFVLGLAVLVCGGPRALRRPAFAAVLAAPPALFLTLTRGPLIAAASVGLAIVFSRARSRWPGALALVLVALVIAASWGSITSTNLYRDRFSNTTNVQARVLLDRWSLELAGRKPVLGWGYGSFDKVKNSANLSSGSLPLSFGLEYTSHNTFLTILVELGGVGLFLLLAPWAVTAVSALRVAARDRSSNWIVVGLLGVVGIWAINAGTVDMRFFPFAWVLPWLAVGLLRRRVLDVEQEPGVPGAA